MSLRRLVRDESGQSVVLFFFVMSALFAILAFLVNIGALLTTKHQMQTAAESAALVAAQEDVSPNAFSRRDFFAGRDAAEDSLEANLDDPDAPVDWAFDGTTNCPGGYCETTRGSTSDGKPASEVNILRVMEIEFAAVLGLIGFNTPEVTLHASAVAGTEIPLSVHQVAPLALECDPDDCLPDAALTAGVRPWPLAPAGGSTIPFSFRNPPDTATRPRLVPIRYSAGTDTAQLDCAPLTDISACDNASVEAMQEYERLDAPFFKTDLDAHASDEIRIVAIFDEYLDNGTPGDIGDDSLHVVGWAAVSWEAPVTPDPIGNPEEWAIDVTFHKLFVDSTWMTDQGVANGQYDFGVNAVGVTGCASVNNGCGG